jgi:superfamily II DNA or RNA helicase
MDPDDLTPLPPDPPNTGGTIADIEARIAALDAERAALVRQLEELKRAPAAALGQSAADIRTTAAATSTAEKLALFRSLFRGRDDMYARRWEDPKTGKSGYAPACRYNWPPGATSKSQAVRTLLPLTDDIVLHHLSGIDPAEGRGRATSKDFTIGIYALLPGDACWFLAIDFDKSTWREDALAYVETCAAFGVPAAMERSRSGDGAHVWIFFDERMPASLARMLGSFLLTRTMERRPEIGLDSYDRLFPSQDTMPKGGFGNLIALPLQRKPRLQGNSVFVDDNLTPYENQVGFLATVRRMSRGKAEGIVEEAQRSGRILGVRMVVTEADEDHPWTSPPSRRAPSISITGPLPARISVVVGNQLFVPKEGLPPSLIDHLVRLAAFQNPEFYKAQAMRFSTFDKPRIISCAESFPKHIGMPRGSLDEVQVLFDSLGIGVDLDDQRLTGTPIGATFRGTLFIEQQVAADSLLAHDNGVLAATTAFGKTVVATYLIAERAVNTLIVVHNKQLMDQWRERLGEFLDIDPKQIGCVGAGRQSARGIVDIAMVQSLYRKGVVKDVVGNYGHLVVDECHHVSALSFEQVARAFKGRYVTGLSATVVRKDGRHPIIFMQCGPIRYRAGAKAEAAKRPFEHRVIVRRTGFRGVDVEDLDAEAPIHALYAAIAGDEARNDQIVQDIGTAVAAGRSPLVLTERTGHLELLIERLRPVCRNVVVLRGGMGARQRRAVTEQIAGLDNADARVLIGTGRYVGEGFDDARLDTLFLTMPVSWKGTIAQYAGRLHRAHEGKAEVVIYDYADLANPVLARMFERRVKGYRAIGYKIDAAP